jgi:hypothetical protein
MSILDRLDREMPGKPTIDLARWPVAVARFPRVTTVEGVDAHFREIAELLDRGECFAMVIDMLAVGIPPATIRAHAGKRLGETYHHELSKNLVGVAHVIDAAFVRGVLTAVYWLAPPPFETAVFGAKDAAIDWAYARVKHAGK